MIYFIRQGDTNFIKIGYTNGNPQKRLDSLQGGNPQKLELIAQWESGSAKQEWQIHKYYSKWRMLGEWFDLPTITVDQIEQDISDLKRIIQQKIIERVAREKAQTAKRKARLLRKKLLEERKQRTEEMRQRVVGSPPDWKQIKAIFG